MEIKDFIRARLVTVHRELLAIDAKGQELEKNNVILSEKIKNPTSEESFVLDLKNARLHYAEFNIAQKNFETGIGTLVELATMFKMQNFEDITDSEKEALAFEVKMKMMVKPFYVIENGVVTGKDMEVYNSMIEYLEKDFSKHTEQDREFFTKMKEQK